ncbi:MAG: prepilin-type N-terminal cleavage/methylation domain-containing protein [Phycisphaerales bacterium]
MIKNNGFSLTEVLMAVGILSIGIMLVATMFPAAIYLTTVASEKTMASIVADEAFAKMQLFGFKLRKEDQLRTTGFYRYWEEMQDGDNINNDFDVDPNEYIYPSLDGDSGKPQYSWSALCKKLNDDPLDNRYLVKLYVTRKTSSNMIFFKNALFNDANNSDWPVPVCVDVLYSPPNKLTMGSEASGYVNPPPSTVIIDNKSGRLFRIISSDKTSMTLDRNWDNDINTPKLVWVVPSGKVNDKPAGKNPDIDVFQKIIDFKK